MLNNSTGRNCLKLQTLIYLYIVLYIMTNLFYDTLIENFVTETKFEVDHSMNGDGFKNCFPCFVCETIPLWSINKTELRGENPLQW